MCRVGTIYMIAPGCHHARQTGWQDSTVIRHLSSLVVPCAKCDPSRPFCSKLSIDTSLDDPSQLPPYGGSSSSSASHALAGPCKFCGTYRSDIRRAERIKQTLTQYNMALLTEPSRAQVGAEMDDAFQRAVDEAVYAYGMDGKKSDKALRVLDAEYKGASEKIGRLCGERQLAPYQEWYGAPGYGR
ncbi:hypothetical protein F5Y15DRAFT_307872 [Xylariaceae sp. FL0016]|nr:hypothetical protein F5Y15DRAFT_307872 [Xylariaceae sp. FL0016]